MTRPFARFACGAALAAAVGAAWGSEPPAPDPIRFDIIRYEVAGNTLLGAGEIDAALRGHTGSGRDFGDVQRALEALEALYHARGYQVVTVRLPEQELNRGVVRLDVVQTRIGRILVSGNTVVDEANVRRALPALQAGATPDLDRVSANLRMANQNPARRISLNLQTGSADDELDARLLVSDSKPWTASLNLDNSGTGPTGTTHAGVVLQHANLWGRDHVGSLQYTTTVEEPGKVSVYGAGYHIPLYELGDSVDLYASYSDIDSGAVTAGIFNLAVSGKGTVAGLRYNRTLARRGGLDPRLVVGLDHKAYKNSVLLAGQDFGNDVTVHPLSATYLASMGVKGGQASFSLGVVRNVAGGSRGGSADFARARSGAKAGYSIARFAAGLQRAFGGDWQGRAALSGQVSGDALVPGEQFGAGGATSVRGVDERAVSTDSGLLANLELYSPNWCAARQHWQCRVLAFVDAAHGRRRAVLPGEAARATLSSAGVGWRFSMGKSLDMQIDYGHVLRRDAGVAGKNKVHVRVGLAY
ncbi:ShlB/FhaC/HecB family hemolysin secretion/activation protein [Massilia sp. CCM 8733]|uniref:ShlB/FhaC/HecB family hemolysin secretion/activation protein n=1 Tax=Massilia mucilaginosa TaxID=2609282 RepID=A0ABX0P2B0_9BURK|nr:ShlB/FhaC/HecB family hemolysin secretion/activation protein [Massilia mucilaginosa]NHZ93438.1 ShlB/FhaC/HecB family hemolysin secretion/activation protein [Massilia mucilaginosa]